MDCNLLKMADKFSVMVPYFLSTLPTSLPATYNIYFQELQGHRSVCLWTHLFMAVPMRTSTAFHLKVPKREIFDRSDFPDFYTIKSSWVGDSLVKILTSYFNF